MIEKTSIVEDMKIISNREIAKDIYEMVLEGVSASLIQTSGQFLHLKMPSEHLLLRRPISIASHHKNQCTLLYRIKGAGTREMSGLASGDTINSLGPLGQGFKIKAIPNKSEVLLVGGGIGVAPLYQLAKDLHGAGHKVTSVLGFASHTDIYYEAEFRALGEVIITTDDGSYGILGHVGNGVVEIQPEVVYACGPTPLLKFVQAQYHDLDHVYISLEERMGCGIGACHACDTKKKDKRVCKDGPVFHRDEVEL